MLRSSTNGRLISAALVLSISFLGSAIMGLLRLRALTTIYGAGDMSDAFLAAFRLPDLIFNIVVIGALSATFIPLFTEKLVKGKARRHAEAFLFANSVLNIVLLIMLAVSGLYALLAEHIVPLITPGFTGEKLTWTITLSRIMTLQPILLSISFVFSGMLNSFKRFVVYALAPIFYNVGIIIGIIFLAPWWGVSGLAWGVVLGASLHMAVQLPSVWKLGWRWQPVMRWTSHDIKTLRRMILPRLFGLSSQQVNLFLVTILGSTLTAGSISAFHFADNIQSLPISIFGVAFAQAAFPSLAEHMSRNQWDKFRGMLTQSFRYILFFVIPVSVFFFLLRAQLVRVLFGAGQFDWEDTILTFETLGFLLISLFAQATIPLLTRAFYVQQNTIIPVITSLGTIIINIILAFALVGPLGVQGLALAISISAIIQLMALLGILHWKLDGFNDQEVLNSLVRISISALVAGTALQLLKGPVSEIVDMTRFWGIFMQIVITGLGGTSVYLFCMWIFGSDELKALRRYVPRREKMVLPSPSESSSFEGLGE